VNPPLRTAADVHALREALADGTIDIVATDHAPHPTESKECEWQEAAFGMLGLETALSIVQKTMVDTGLMNWIQVADRMSIAPARTILGYWRSRQPCCDQSNPQLDCRPRFSSIKVI
jgi:dihydroorotase